jgi:hypothetical protein
MQLLVLEGPVSARRAASVVLAAVVLLSTAGCTFFAPQTTLKPYDPSDGVGTQVGNVKVANALLLTSDDSHASLVLSVINGSDNGVSLKLQYEGVNEDGKKGRVNDHVFVNEGDVKSLGGRGEKKLLIDVEDAKPGTLFPIYFQYGSHPGKELLVPVLDGTLPQYTKLLPAKVTPTPTPTPTPTSTPSN